jgi:FHS family glucose/mannose:H+ symporter-like MFS transporter
MRTPLGTIILSCIVFITLGILTAALGPVLPDLAQNTRSSLEATGAIFTALFLGALVSQSVSGPMTDKLGPRPVLVTGMGILVAGMLGVSFAGTYFWLIASGFIAGLGHGAVDISTNILVAKVFKERSVTALNLVNFFFGVGAVVGPAVVSVCLRTTNTGIPAIWIGSAILTLCVPFGAAFLLSPKDIPLPENLSTNRPFYFSPLLWIAGLLLFVYVGTENGIGGWTAAYMQRTTTLKADSAALIVAGFWLALTIGRLIAALVGTKWSSGLLLKISLIGAILGGVLMAVSTGNQNLTILAVLITGLFFGPIYPTTFSITTSLFNQSSGKAASIVVAMASLGGMVIPPLQGILLVRYNPNSSVLLVAGCTVTMLILFVLRNHFLHQPAATVMTAQSSES